MFLLYHFIYLSKSNINEAIDNSFTNISLTSYQEAGGTIPQINFKLSLLNNYILNLPKALLGCIMSPKYILPIVIIYKITTGISFTVKESPTIDLEYTVFIFFVNYSRNDQSDLVKKFNEEKYKMYTKKIHMKRTYDENDYMSFDTLSEFNSRRRWERIIKYVLKNPEFYACVTSPNRKSFAIK